MKDLVQALRDEAAVTQSKLLYEAANRIEEPIHDLVEWYRDKYAEACNRIETLEKALREIIVDWSCDCYECSVARTALKDGGRCVLCHGTGHYYKQGPSREPIPCPECAVESIASE